LGPFQKRDAVPYAKPFHILKKLIPGLLMTLLMAGIFILRPTFLDSLQYKVYDFFAKAHPQRIGSDLPVVVAIDEKTVQEFGQWPWPRYRMALLAEKINRLGPSGIALDVMFPESDRTSPAVFEKELMRDLNVKAQITGLPDELKDHDRLLARVLQGGPFLLSYAFLFHDPSSQPLSKPCHPMPLKAAIAKPKMGWHPSHHLPKGKGIICSLEVLNHAARGSGFVNTLPSDDGVVRRTPLLVSYKEKLYPSLALVNLMHAMDIQNVALKIETDGDIFMRLGRRIVPLDGSGSLWIRFSGPGTLKNIVSAGDILRDKIPAERLKDRMVFLGITAAGIGDRHPTPMAASVPGVEIQAAVADNILAGQFITRPAWSDGLQLMVILFCGLLLSLLFLPRNPLWGVLGTIVLFMGLVMGSWWLFAATGLFLSPLISVLTVGTLFVLLNLSNLQAALSRAKALRRSKLKADEVSRFKSEFLANMSHEIRTPMNAIMGLSHLALQTDLSPKQADYLNKILNSAKSLLGIINDVLDFSKIEAGKLNMESVDFQLADVLDNLGSLISLKAEEKGLEFLFDVDPEAPNHLVGDPLRLGQVLINLANNAVKFTHRGEVIVGVRVLEKHDKDITFEFSVRDTGIGLSREQQEGLFKPFAQADAGTTRQYGGTGLGLSISKRLVHMMGGEIRVESELKRGSTFSFTANFKIQPEKSPWHPGMDSDLRGRRVLVVDDNPTALQIMQTLLSSFGFDVHTVDSGKRAISKIRDAHKAHEKPYELVFMDWKMPEMTGIQCALAIKTLALDITPKIILVTAYSREKVIREAEKAALDGLLFKPLNPSILFDTIMETFGRKVHKKPRATGIGATLKKSLERIRGARILLVEDNVINQQVAQELLETAGLSVTIVSNGREAVSAVGEGTFDLVLTDIHMPVMDGFQATAQIRKNPALKDLPIVAMTAQALSGDREKSLEAGMNDHITKPIDPDKLFATLVKWIPPGKEIENIEPALEKSPTAVSTGIEDMPGLNVGEGLRRVAGNRELYEQLIHDFASEFESVATRLEGAMKENRLEDMASLVHGLKGVSGNLGADRLNAAASALEKAIQRKGYRSHGKSDGTFGKRVENRSSFH
jgi:signal transduction histidine kinase/CheY-like chemotaxis protein